jgi:hypothetical protein
MLFALLALGASFERLRRVHGATTLDLGPLSKVLGRNPTRRSLVRLRDAVRSESSDRRAPNASGPTGWELDVLDAAVEANSAAERTARVDEILGDVGAALHWGHQIPIGAARLSALGAMAVLFFDLALSLGPDARHGTSLGYILPPLAWGGVGVVGALTARREADRAAAEARRSIDAWIERVLAAAVGPEA